MRLFYPLKFSEIILTLIPLITIFLTDEICTPFIPNKAAVQRILNNKTCELLIRQVIHAKLASSIDVGAILDSEDVNRGDPKAKSRMGKFFGEVLRSWDALWGYDDSEQGTIKRKEGSIKLKTSLAHSPGNHVKSSPATVDSVSTNDEHIENWLAVENLSSDVELNGDRRGSPAITVRTPPPQWVENPEQLGFKQCAKIRLGDYFGHGDEMDSVSEALRNFGAPIIFFVWYLIFTFFHCIDQDPLPYGCCTLTFALVSLVGWVFVLFRMYFMESAWEQNWIHSNFRPELINLIGICEMIAPIMIVYITIELLYGNILMSQLSITDNHRIRRRESGEVRRRIPRSLEEY